MDIDVIAKLIQSEWTYLSSAPLTAIVSIIVIATGGYFLVKAWFGRELRAKDATIESLNTLVSLANAMNGVLVDESQGLRNKIKDLEKQLDQDSPPPVLAPILLGGNSVKDAFENVTTGPISFVTETAQTPLALDEATRRAAYQRLEELGLADLIENIEGTTVVRSTPLAARLRPIYQWWKENW